ncbi:hypothetical protein [Roseovarius sp. M141]|uniref:hypothetical protein n=1 Tax=Roseovarius sp. M141 TaxID=2583806 RepID=UPI0020CBBA33|nr:hypothetical protein [Roseovarius sp. M141]MCQ0091057.1 hypothetical protein [Roseovarius sp. M141]
MLLFYCATLAPAGLIALGAMIGGPWPTLAVVYMTVLVTALDRLLSAVARDDTEGDGDFPAAVPFWPFSEVSLSSCWRSRLR